MEGQQKTVNKKVKIPPYAKIKVYWDDKPENYSKENKRLVINYFASKYGVSKSNITVVYRPIKINEKGETIEISGAGIDNIMDVGYQRELFKEWLEREGKEVDFSRLIKLDDKVNSELNIDLNDSRHKSWSLKWIMINGFLCFGPNNYVPLSNLNGLTIVNSDPENQGGKTTFSIDSFKFLLYGKTTKTDKNEQVFNQYWDNDKVVVRGMVILEDKEIIIERIMSRKPKRNGGWNVTNSLNYYEVLPDGEEREMNEEDATATTLEIKNIIGSESDFELVTLATANNLDDLIGLSVTESGRLLTRFIGLEIIEFKSEVVRKMYNNFAKTKKSNLYDILTLKNEIEGHEDSSTGTTIWVDGHKQKIENGKDLLIDYQQKLDDNEIEIGKLNDEKDNLLSSKKQIDSKILTLNPSKLEEEIRELKERRVENKGEVEKHNKLINEIGEINFDEDRHHKLTNDKSTQSNALAVKEAEGKGIRTQIDDLIAGGICKACNRPLDDVDNSDHIKEHEQKLEDIGREYKTIKRKLDTITKELEELDKVKADVDRKDKLELERDRLEMKTSSIDKEISDKNDDLGKYNSNIDAIEFNRDIDTKTDLLKTKIRVCEHTKTELTQKIERTKMDIFNNEDEIEKKEKLIQTIKKEDEVEKIFKVYIEMVGKKGISKLVLRSVLPIINAEVQRLLEDVTDFDIEIFINEKNDVEFMLIKDGVEKYLKSGSGLEQTAASIALRCVLGKMSCLPMPNFITFDEVLGKVAQVNIPLMKPLFDKITDMYEIVFFITHNEIVKDWGDNIITIKKENNISSISVK